ncbi:MAG: hypothetical protein KKH41_09610 [Candidatus Thermoplasmatota archaeon]|nr:hypothetical protein [Candidatus Thermoplasmatota archaeon]MBU4071589.1 hypothetical protein [Candidatus Thermoplasmatota archaeon]MBU4144349.1 hypothetical protein [Candidatus Thermoplasmatota archaeon]MBU4592821.1 hypothetical protein [Candidatus Thermoplasmatota archaeon]
MAQTKLRLVTVSERICIYLDRFPPYDGERDGPFELTQIGIATAVDVARSNFPRAIQPLMDNQLVNNIKAHIPGIRQKRFIYYLTMKGKQEARSIRTKLLNTKLRVIDIHGQMSTRTPEEIQRRFLGEFHLDDILFSIPLEEPFDCRIFIKNRTEREVLVGKQVKKDTDGKHFHGRESEIASIRQWLNSDRSNTLIIKGMPGIGKSTLVANLMDEISLNYSVHFFNINPWCSLRPLVQFLANSFGKIGMPELKSYLDEHPEIEIYELEYLLSRIFSGRKLMLIFDNFQNINANLKIFFTMLKKVVDETGGVKLIILGRNVEPFYEMSAAAIDNTVLEITLEGLKEPGMLSLARSFEIPEERIGSIMAQTGGHPLFIELLVHGKKSNGHMDIERFIAEEFVTALTGEEINVLKFISVFRFPIERHALRSYKPALVNLFNKSILKRSEDDFIILHDVLKDAFYRQLSGSEMKKYHSKAARYYLENLQISSQMEAVHHFLYAGRADSAAEIMIAKMDTILNTDNKEYLARLLTMLLCSDLDIGPDERALLLHAQGTALAFIGEMDSAMENYTQAIELVEPGGDMRIAMKARVGIAKIMLRRNMYEEAEAVFRVILKWASKHDEAPIEAEANYRLGAIYERLGVPEQALVHYKKAWTISIGTNDKKQQAQALYGMGNISHTGRNFEWALKRYDEALNIALASGNEHMASKILTRIGWTLSELGRLNEEIETYNRAISLSRKSGSVRVLAYALSNAGAVYIDKPNFIQASEYLEEALFLFEKLGERRMIATVKLNMASIKVLRGKHKEGTDAFREVRIILEALKDKGKLMTSYFKFGQAMRKVEKTEQAMKLYKKALHISRDIGDSDASKQILLEMQDLSDVA